MWEGFGDSNGLESWARPALMAIEVWMQRRNGELCRATSYLLRFGFAEASVFWLAARSSSCTRSRIIDAILAPKLFACCQPL